MDTPDHGSDAMTFDVSPGPPRLEPGTPQILGANWTGRGTNFAVEIGRRAAGMMK